MIYLQHQMFDLYLAFWGLKVVGMLDASGNESWKIERIK